MNPHCPHKDSDGSAGGLAFILVICLLGGLAGFQKARDRQKAQSSLREFVQQQSPRASEKWVSLQTARDDLGLRVKALGRELTALGREPESDRDYRVWSEVLVKSENAVARLEEKLSDAYLLHRKHLLSPKPELEREMGQVLEEGLQNARAMESELLQWQENFITEGGRTIPIRRAVLADTSKP